ncbi:phage minor head protein [Paenibacillus sinopodophylli]|uniref:phage minor head protein n=1 Tax=Paenibacillus sinopodophylli TaxID=1837342 RepID=UPI001BB14DC2|nr:phage minor head protein [Paenibacillus sinopodophylli]
MAANPKPHKNEALDKRIAEREARLEAHVNKYDDIMDKRAAQYAAEIKPFWNRAGKVIGEEMAKIVAEMQDANGVPIRRQPIRAAKMRNMQRALEHLGKLQRYVREAEQTGKLTNNLAFTYTDSYYYNAFGLQQAAQLAILTPVITHAQVIGVLANPWLPDGNTYSDRLRANTALLGLKMRESVEEAVQKGWDTQRIARRIKDIAGEGYYNSVRLARTEMTRAAGQGASHLFMQNADVLDGKRWNATLDSRTAPKDAANDRKIYELGYDTPEIPGRPGERIPNHPNCRCKWSPVLASLGVREGERIARGDGDTPTNFGENIYTNAKDYRAYAKERGIDLDDRLRNDDPRRYLRRDERGKSPALVKGASAATAKAVAAATWAAPVTQLIAGGVVTEEKAREVGDLIRKEVERRVKDVAPVMQQNIDELTAEVDTLFKGANDFALRLNAMDSSDPSFLQLYDEYMKKYGNVNKELAAKREVIAKAKKELAGIRANAAVEALTEIRPMGSKKAHKWDAGSHTKAKVAIAQAQRFYPTAWLNDSHSFNSLDAKVVTRGYYSGGPKGYSSEFKISGTTEDDLTSVAVHEFGHRFEHIRPEIKKLEKQFYDRRTAGEDLEWIGKGLPNSGYSKSEVARFDKFLSRYMGKDYGNKETSYFEIFTMGAESIFTGTHRIDTDPDYYNFIMGVLASV